jgi:ATP-dependent helicase/nuclease subunit B
MYLALDNSDGKVRTAASLQDEQLLELRTATANRLHDIVRMQTEGHAMPAWGDEISCAYCDFSGLCRRQVWSAEEEAPAAAQNRG